MRARGPRLSRNDPLRSASAAVLSSGITYSQMRADEKTWWGSQPKSRFDKTPGPTAYPAPKLPHVSGGRFNMSNPKTDVEIKMRTAASVPGPGAYESPSLGREVSGELIC